MTGNFLEDNQQLCMDTSEGNPLAQDGSTSGNPLHEDGWTKGSSLTRDGGTLGCFRRYFWEGQKLQDESSKDVENGIHSYRGLKKGAIAKHVVFLPLFFENKYPIFILFWGFVKLVFF